jgi:S-DNA-T family DNA segregation ATPase FtsK/SpoIIIE
VHVVVTAARYMEVRSALKDQMLGRLELRLGDVMDSEFNRKVAANVPAGVPGRGQVPEKLHFMSALPRMDGVSSSADLSDGTAAFVSAVRGHWSGAPAPEVRLLPRRLPSEQLPKGFEFPQQGIAIGIDETNLEPVFVDFETDPFFIIFGESESGKTALLRLIAKQISERYTPEQARIVVGDYRRSMLEAVPSTHLLEYAPMASSMDMHMDAIATVMTKRAPKPDITPQELRDRSWWSGPQLFVLVDDYELVATNSGNPMARLVEDLPFARDVGVRFIVARSAAGASRASFEPFMQRMKELGAQGVVPSGDPGEGDILGHVRARRMPPGRGTFFSRRRGTPLVQLGWLPDR